LEKKFWGEKEPIVCINGRFFPLSKTKISPFDHGLLYGLGVWDVAWVYNGYSFKLDENVNRLFKSAKALKVIARPRRPISNPSEVKGKKAVIVSIRRIPPMCGVETRIKQLNYLNHYLMLMEAKRNGADCAIALDIYGYVTEGAVQNIFIVKDQNIYTPPTASVLEGITRGTVIDIAGRKSFGLIEKLLTPYDLYTADEVFLTSANIITPIIEIDGRKVGDGKPGPITIEILTEYWEMIQKGEHSIKIV